MMTAHCVRGTEQLLVEPDSARDYAGRSPMRIRQTLRWAACLGIAVTLGVAEEGKWTPQQLLQFSPQWLKQQGLQLPVSRLWDPQRGVGLLAATISTGGCSAGFLRLKDPAPVPEWRSPQDPRAAITLDELMRMSSGLRFKEDYKNPRSDAIRMLLAEPDAGAYAAGKPLDVPPNSRWSYSSGTTNIISRIVRQSVGGSLSDYFAFAHRALFDRVGMASAVIEPDASGTFVGSSFMYATPRDWARFGLLYLNDGMWKNERILPEGWVKYSTTPTPNAPKGEYGAQFWLNAGRSGQPEDRWMPKVPPDMYSLRGFEGQYVSIIPSKKLVIVRLGLSVAEKAWDQEQFIADVIEALKG